YPVLTPSSTGHIPPQLGNLGALQYLSLDNNKLDGELNNSKCDLRRSNIYKNESQINFFESLAKFDLLFCLAGPIPPELGKLTALENLR
ncbi:unnamed protein product, partial [Ectocarpus sp. 8 AP-2014]